MVFFSICNKLSVTLNYIIVLFVKLYVNDRLSARCAVSSWKLIKSICYTHCIKIITIKYKDKYEKSIQFHCI